MKLKDWIWVSNKSIGVIVFRTPIQEYIESIGAFMSEPADDITGWETYKIEGEYLSIYVDNNLVLCVTAYGYLD